MNDALIAALDYAHHGLRVLPIKPGEKRPPMPAWQDAATTNPERINSWWSGLYAGHGVGIATGHGVFVLDVDISDGKAGDETLRALEDSYGPLTDTVRVITGSGGAHIYYRYPEGTEIRNDAGRKLGPGLDIRGTGGQVVAPPTLHPTSGQQYAWEDGCGLDDIEIAEAPDWLLELLTAQPDITPSVMPTVTAGDDGPAARYNDSTNWTDLLTRDGWTLSHTDRTGCQHWVRPGKDARDGTSATVNYEGRDILRVFTSSVAGLPEGAYNRFGYTAAMHHNGDRSAFASELVRQEDRGLSLTAFHPTIAEPGDPWPAPIPLGSQKQQLPTFPVEVFPDWIAEQAQAVADELQMPVDLPANLALIALATVAARAATINVSGRWTEPLNVYIAVAMPPSAGKSPAFNFMTGPIRRHEEQLADAAAQSLEFKAQTKRIIEKRMAKAEAANDVDEARMALMELLELGDLTPPRLTADDATPEALTQLLAEQDGRIAILSTEGGLFDLMTGRYSDKANLDVYLKGWSGDTITVDRIGRGQSKVLKPALTIGLTVQPTVIAALADKPELAGRGLTARFMYSLPVDNVGHRDFVNPTSADPAIGDRYDIELTRIAEQLHGTVDARIGLDPRAHRTFLAWKQELEHRRRPDGELRPLAEWSTKLESTTIRTAGLLHIAHGNGADGVISEDIMSLAIEVGDYWIAHAQAVHDMWGRDPMLDKARIILDFAEGRESFTIRDLYSKRRAAFPRADDTIVPLGILVERGWLRPVDNEWPPRIGARGKESPTITVHPAHARHARHARPETASDVPEMNAHARHARVVPRDITEITHSLSSQEQEDKEHAAHDAHDAHEYPQADLLPTGTDDSFNLF
jgi:replicative DNA helicase